MKKVLIVDERRGKRPPDNWWAWLSYHYQTHYTPTLFGAVDLCKNPYDLVIIGQLEHTDVLLEFLTVFEQKNTVIKGNVNEVSLVGLVRSLIGE
jgi:hypothetical protein